jgi:hypothetical protein
MRIAPLFIATSLATILVGNVALMGVAHAAAMDARDVTKMLARSQALDVRCRILSANQSQDLRDLVARAEIALAGKFSVAVARDTLAKGRAEGKVAACDAAAFAEVRNILKAGLQATIAAPTETKAEQPTASAPAPIAQPKPKAVVASAPVAQPAPKATMVAPKKTVIAQKPAAPVTVKKQPLAPVTAQTATQVTTEIKSKKKVSLASYSSLAEKYYIELKCHTMPLSSAKRLYEDVLVQHRAAMASGGALAVRKILKNARSRAGSQSCT